MNDSLNASCISLTACNIGITACGLIIGTPFFFVGTSLTTGIAVTFWIVSMVSAVSAITHCVTPTEDSNDALVEEPISHYGSIYMSPLDENLKAHGEAIEILNI
jgi:hypothetical protein